MEAPETGKEPETKKDPKPKRKWTKWVKVLIVTGLVVIRAVNDLARFVSQIGDWLFM